MADEQDLSRPYIGYRRQRATPSSEETKEVMAKDLPELVADYFLPQDAADVGMMLLPGGKVARKAGAALIAGGTAGEAEAGGLTRSLLKMVDGVFGKPAAQAAVKEAPREQKMLQGFYRGYAGDYDAAKAAEDAGMVFVTPQRRAGEYYADKRARQTGQEPHLEMILADPFAGRVYGHSIPLSPQNRVIDFTRARQLQPEDVKSRTPLYATGGAVHNIFDLYHKYAEGGDVQTEKAPTAEDYARAQIKQWLNRDATAEEAANIARGITVDQNKPYATRVWYDPLGQRIEQPVFMTGGSRADVIDPSKFVGAAEEQNIPYTERNAGQVLGKDNALYSTMEHGELLRTPMDAARIAYMRDQAAKDTARLGPYSRGPFTEGPVNYQLQNAVAQAVKLGPVNTPDAKRSLAQQIVQLGGVDPTGRYDPEVMSIVNQLRAGARMARGGAAGVHKLYAKYAEGGAVGSDQAGVNRMVAMEQGGLAQYDPDEIDAMASRMKEEMYG